MFTNPHTILFNFPQKHQTHTAYRPVLDQHSDNKGFCKTTYQSHASTENSATQQTQTQKRKTEKNHTYLHASTAESKPFSR